MAGARNARSGEGDRTMARRTRTAAPAHRRSDHGRVGGDGGERHQPVRGAGLAADRGAPPRRGPEPALARIGVCALCGRQARDFGYVHQLRWETFPYHRFCSLRCLDAGSASAMRNNGMIDKTDMEQRALRDARRFLAETLTELGLMEPFYHRKAGCM